MGRLVDAKTLQEAYKAEHNGKRLMLIDTAETVEAIPVKDLEKIAQTLRNSREYELRVVGNAIPGIVSAWKEKQEERKE